EEGEARDRVEQGREDAERRLEPVPAMGEQRGDEGEHEADADRDQRQLEVLDEVRLEDVPPVRGDPVPAEGAVGGDAAVGTAGWAAEVRDVGGRRWRRREQDPVHDTASGSRAERRVLTWSIVSTPIAFPSPSTTRPCRSPDVSSCESASRSVAEAANRRPAS